MKTSLRDITLKLLLNRPISESYKSISKKTGLPEGWLKSFASGKSKHPSVNRVETLYTHLSGKVISYD